MTNLKPVQQHGRVDGSGFAVEEADAAHVHGPIVGGGHNRHPHRNQVTIAAVLAWVRP
jgi:hypothetical protein